LKPAAVCLLTLALAALCRADNFGSGANSFSIDFATVGNPGNPDDAGAGGGTSFGPYGGVSYVYRIGVTEVPASWIVNATAAGLTNVTTAPWTGSQPAAGVTWYEAAAFVNWLNTSTGHQAAYDLTWTGMTWTMNVWSSGNAWQLGGENLYRHKDAYYFLPSEDEWYKAGYHQNDGVTANYWDYTTASNAAPTPVQEGTTAGTAVFNSMLTGANKPADVGISGGLSGYGTRGQGGNLKEWMESAFDGVNDTGFEFRTSRGGGVQDEASFLISGGPESRVPSNPSVSDTFVGFRVGSIPEPSTALLILAGGFCFIQGRGRRVADNRKPVV
jgi:hypothetical protein